jgi:hypothetical protein
MLIPIKCFLNRVFPLSFYKNDMQNIVENKIFKPRKDCEDFKLIFPINWESLDKKEDRNWRMQLQGWAMFHPIMNFFDDYHDKKMIINYFFDVCFDWNNTYGSDEDDIVTTRMPESYAWYDMSVGFRALVLAFFIDRIEYFKISISEEQKNLLEKLSLKHINHLKLEKVFSLNNHGMFQIQGLMALIQLNGVDNYKDEYEYALLKMEELILSQYDTNGVHLEHSPHYHFYALTTFENILTNDWYIKKPIISKIVQKANAIKKWLVDPYKRPACIGDSIMTVQRSVNLLNNDFSEELEILTEDKKYVYSNFNDSGYGVFRTEWNIDASKATFLFFMAMYHRKTHKHRDCLSFEWFDNGEKIICDGGKYGYVSDKYRKYFLSYKAHNTVEIDGFDILKIKPYGSALGEQNYNNNNIFITEGKLDYPAIKFNRTLYLNPSKWLIIEDSLDFVKARKVKQWLHLNKNYNFISTDNNLLKFKSEKKELIIHCLTKDVASSLYFGDEENLQGFVSENDFIYEENFAIGFEKFIKQDSLITILALGQEYYYEALNYIDENEIYSLKNDNKSLIDFSMVKSMIKNIQHTFYSTKEKFIIHDSQATYSTFVNNMKFDCYINNKKNTDKLIVMLPGAIDRTKVLQNFQRYSWSKDINHSMISFLDPTIQENNDLSIGWFQGEQNNFALTNLISLLFRIIKDNNIKEENIVFFGSSAGGFSVLQLANAFNKSKIIAINPQLYLYNYSQLHFNNLLDYSYNNLDKEYILSKFNDRLEVKIDLNKRNVPIFIYQNTCDTHHMEKHLKYFLNTLDESLYSIHKEELDLNKINLLNIIYYTDPESGHAPPNKQITIDLLNKIINIKD